MAKVQTRRCISMRPASHALLKAHSEETGIPMAQIVTKWINFFFEGVEKQKKADVAAANRTVAELGMSLPKGKGEWR